ncbi:hypothetical protein AO997_33685 [Pseudomonas aeruginosa]|nr:hypothetical protein AO997_33685 [Pseudomonas aeruginosa]
MATPAATRGSTCSFHVSANTTSCTKPDPTSPFRGAFSFGRPFIGNPDLVERLRGNQPLAAADSSVYYGGGANGYTDFPTFSG